MTATDILWNEKAAEVALWVKAHKRLPKRSRTVSVEENRLGRWLEDNERSITKNTGHNLVTPARTKRIASIKKLTEPKKKYYYPHKKKPNVNILNREERWNLNAHALAAFQKENGRNPQKLSGDIGEDKLAVWRMTQQGGASQERQAKLDAIAPGWRGIKRTREINTTDDWKGIADEYAAFIQTYSRLPQFSSVSNNETHEARLYFFMNQQRYFLNKGKLAEDRKAYLDEKIPGWADTASSHDDKWAAHFAFMKTFYAEHGRFPTVRKDKDNPLAKKAAIWLSNQRYALKKYDTLSEREKTRLDMLREYLVSISKG